MRKYHRVGHAIDDNMAHKHFMLDTQGYKHTLRTCNTYCFSTATMVARKRLDVTLYVNCLSLFLPFLYGVKLEHGAVPPQTKADDNREY